MKFFDHAILIAQHIAGRSPHARQPELRDLRDATHSTCVYYEFIDTLVCRRRPIDVIEIGTYVGTSAAHFAFSNYVKVHDDESVVGSPSTTLYGQVTTVDINPDAKRCVEEVCSALKIPNIRALTGNSLELVEFFAAEKALVDVLFIDGLHNFSQAYREYFHYRQFVREGGLILVDDAGLAMEGDEMNRFWNLIPEPKVRVDHLHPNVGFGIVEKRNVPVVTPAQAIEGFTKEDYGAKKRFTR